MGRIYCQDSRGDQVKSIVQYWIYPIECDFCYDKSMDLFYVDMCGTPESYTACMKCIKKKGWQ